MRTATGNNTGIARVAERIWLGQARVPVVSYARGREQREADVSGRFHYYAGIVKVQESDAGDIELLEQFFSEAGLDRNDYSTQEAVAALGREYAMGYFDIEDKSAHLTWKNPMATPGVLAEAEEAFRVWAESQGYEPWFAEPA